MVFIVDFVEFLSALFLYLGTLCLIVTLYRHFRGMHIPFFWFYFLASFFLLTIRNLTLIALPQERLLNNLLSLSANVMIFLAAYGLYRRFRR